MKANELREKSEAELREELINLTTEQFNLRMQAGSGQSIRPHQVKAVRRDIARVKTVLREMVGTSA